MFCIASQDSASAALNKLGDGSKRENFYYM